MYTVVVLGLLAVVAVSGQKYTTKYDGLDLDNIVRNDRLLNIYFNCVMDKGKCSPEGKELKSHIPEALDNDCENCSETQRAGSKKVLKYIYDNKPEMFKQLEQKYDPAGKYRTKYLEEGKQAGIPL